MVDTPRWLRDTQAARRMPRHSQRKRQLAAAKANQIVLRLPDRTTAIELANRKTFNRSTGEYDRADDAIVDKMIERAINKRSYRDIVELYKLLDAEEAIALSRPAADPSPYMQRKAKQAVVEFASTIRAAVAQELEQGYLELAPGGGVRVPAYLAGALRST